jgi:LacI family transcriptional regulator
VPTTLKDVARVAKVSTATVSRVINGHGNVTSATRERIMHVIESMHYVPDSAARSLSTGQTNTIGVLLPDLHGEFFSELIRGIDQAARTRGLHLLLSGVHGSAAETKTAVSNLRGRVDGLLIMSPYADSTFLESPLVADVPAVVLNSPTRGNSFSSLRVNNRGGARAMVRHLVSLGHRRIVFVAGPIDNYDANERLAGYCDALEAEAAGLIEWIIPGDFTEESGVRAVKKILTMDDKPDAIFAANDAMALGCLHALNQADIKVPEQIALAGFDDIPMARFVSPALTTVRVPMAELGSKALDALATVIDDRSAAPMLTQQIETSLVLRQSAGERLKI